MLKKTIVLIIIFIATLGVSWFVFQRMTPFDMDQNNETPDTNSAVSSTDRDRYNSLPDEPEVYPDWYETDKDNDGLTDDEEQQLGTDMWSSDSDGDSVSDIDEVQKYHTDPMKPDTDGDGFWDGLEITSGYNPNGEGML